MLISADQDETAFGTARLPTERKTYTKFVRENSAKWDCNKQQKKKKRFSKCYVLYMLFIHISKIEPYLKIDAI